MLKVFDDSKNKIGLLDELKDFYITNKLKYGEKTLTFSLYQKEKLASEINKEWYVETENDRYVVKSINNQVNTNRYTCILDLEGLISHLHLYGFSCRQKTLSDMLSLILDGSTWRYEVDRILQDKKTFSTDSENAYEILLDLINHWGVEISFDSKNQIVYIANELGVDKGVYFTDELNLSTFNIEGDTNDFATRLYCRGKDNLTIASVNGGRDYIEDYSYTKKVIPLIWTDERYEDPEALLVAGREKLNELSKPRISYELEVIDLAKLNNDYEFLNYSIGDKVTLFSTSKKIREKHRIVELINYPLEPERNRAILSNVVITQQDINEEEKEIFEGVIKIFKKEFKETTEGLETSVTELTNGLETAKSQIIQNADEIKMAVKKGELSSEIKQHSDAVSVAINNGQGGNGINVTPEGLSVFRNRVRSILFNDGLMNLYNSSNGRFMGYYGTVGDDLRVQLYNASTFSIRGGNTSTKMLDLDFNHGMRYGTSLMKLCGDLILQHRDDPNATGINGLGLGNDDRADKYGHHNLYILCHNSLGLADNNGLTHAFFDVRRGRLIMKGGLYQNTDTPPGTYLLSMDEEHPFFCGRNSNDIVKSILNLETTIKVDDEDDLTMMILPNEDDLVMTSIGGQMHIDQSSIIAGLVEVVKYQQSQIDELKMKWGA